MAKFFPKSQHPTTICNHRHDADVTITEQTDTIQLQVRWAIEYYGFKHNVRVGAFLGEHYANDDIDIPDLERIGNIRSDVYLNVGLSGSNYQDAIDNIIPWFENLTNRKPSAVSFAGGNSGIATSSVNDFLCGRNSLVGQSQYGKVGTTFLGLPQEDFTRLNYSDINSTTRWFDDNLTWSQVETELENVVNSNGWFRNFTHWHDLSSNAVVYKQEEFYQALNDKMNALGKTAHFCSYGEAIEYLTYRQLITRAVCYDSANGNVRVAVEVDDLYLQDRINTPISIKIDLSNSVLTGKDLACDNAVLTKVATDQFIVELPFRIDTVTDNKIMWVELYEGVPNYRTFSPPILNKVISGNDLTINSNVPVNATLFAKDVGTSDSSYIRVKRLLNKKQLQIFNNLNFTDFDYAVGCADEWGNLNVILV